MTAELLPGAFDNEAQAERVAEALRDLAAERQYVIVERGFAAEAKAYYAQSLQEAEELAERLLEQTGKEYRIFSRIKERL